MSKRSLANKVRQFNKTLVRRFKEVREEDDLGRSAFVFAPHFDDETLGCGGTILKKKMLGVEVKVVFMTDGSKSHMSLISEDKLKAIRAREGLAACKSLGLDHSDVLFLDFEDTKLQNHLDTATTKVTDLILQHQLEEIYIPYHKDPMQDHIATNRIVKSALQAIMKEVTIYEYPIWFWHYWPWTYATINKLWDIKTVVKKTFLSNVCLLRDFRSSVYIGDVLGLKRAALDHHKSQMTRLIPSSNWMTLSDVSDGLFLECFFQDYEIFCKYTL